MLYKIKFCFWCLAIIYQLSVAQKVITVPEIANLTYKDYRLEPVLFPSNYKLTLRLDENFETTTKFTVENCTIKFNVAETVKEDQNQIRIHFDLDYINEHIVKLYDDKRAEIKVKMDPPNAQTQIAVITLLNNDFLDKKYQPYSLEFAKVTGTLRTNSHGFYLSEYEYKNQTRYAATTQFESTYARSAFPCFDEPIYKATFDISIIKPKNYTTVLSNTKKIRENPVNNSKLTKVTFEQTPKMSTYLVAFLVSTFENLTNSEDSNYATFFREGHSESAQFAVNVSRRLAENLGNTTGLLYADLGIPELYQIALPDFAAGAMENWGLNTFRESSLLWDIKKSTKKNKQRVLTTVSHETSHTWFGDFVTLNWWSETWLNEGFATYFEFHTAANIAPDFDLRNQFVYQVLQYAFEEDSISSSQQLSSKATDVYTQDHIEQKFDVISYKKGGSVIRMIEHIMTTPRFFTALNKYLDKHRYNNTVAHDILVQFEAEGLPKDSMKEWVYFPGYPVVTVIRVNNNAVLTQQRFLIDDAISTTKWQVPIAYASKVHNKDFNDTIPSHWMKANEDLIIENAFKDSNWIVVNVQQTGFYRVDYGVSLWENLTAALKSENFGGIIPINRAQMIDDVMNMARIKKQTYKVAMDLTKYLEQDEDYYPWASAISSFRILLKQARGDKELYTQLKRYFSKLSTNIIKSVNFLPKPTDSHMTVTKSVLIMSWASYIEEKACIEAAIDEFAKFQANPESYYVDPNVKAVVYCLGVKYGNSSKWDFLYRQFLKSNVSSEREIILVSLACSRNVTILRDYLHMSLNETYGIRRQDADIVLANVINANSTLAYQFFKDNIATIKAHYTTSQVMNGLVTTFADIFTTKEEVEEFTNFITANDAQLGSASGNVAEGAIKTAMANLKWMESFGGQLKEWLKVEGGSGFAVKASFGILVISIVITLLY